LYFALIV